MKELKILAVLLIFTAITYWGIEPFAHSQMHPHVAPANFNFANEDIDLANHELQEAKNDVSLAQKALEKVKNKDKKYKEAASKKLEIANLNLSKKQEALDNNKNFWNEINAIDFLKGDATKGAEVFSNAGCTGCHGVVSQELEAPMSDEDASEAFGVVPPDLSNTGYLYDDHFLAALIKDPVVALKLTASFGDEKPFPMTGFFGTGEADINEELGDIVAYLKSIAPKEMDNKNVFLDSCARCHDVRYDKIFTKGDKKHLVNYMGSVPPDLSVIIRSKGNNYLETFINDPQKQLHGTIMPRVGLTKQAQAQTINYLEEIGDSKKAEREKTGLSIMFYFLILSVFAVLWKLKIWKRLH